MLFALNKISTFLVLFLFIRNIAEILLTWL
jgi:hypothetical protein